MKPLTKVGLIGGGYALALAVAFGVVALYIAAASHADREASSGMFAFADGLLFRAVLGVAAVPSSPGALYLLRPYRARRRIALLVAMASDAVVFAGLLLLMLRAFRRTDYVGRPRCGSAAT